MDFPILKEDFHNRFLQSGSFLHFTSYGLLCTLLGHIDIESAPSINFSLSMRIQMLARKNASNSIKLQNSATNKNLSYTLGTPSKLFNDSARFAVDLINSMNNYNIKGADILYDSSIPKFLPQKETFSVTFIKSLMKTNGIETDDIETAAMCSLHSDITPYLALLSTKNGYCTLMNKGKPKNMPLPLSGYKILTAHCTEKKKDRSKHIKTAMTAIRKQFPHIGSIADVTPEILTASMPNIKSKTASRYMYHLVNENARIHNVSTSLKRCDIKTLFREMKNSQKSMERFWEPTGEHLFLAHSAENLDGVSAVRFWENGTIMIVEEDKVDYVINMVKSDFEQNIGYQPTFCVCETF